MSSTDQAKRIAAHMALALVTIVSLAALGWIVVDSWIMPRIARSGWEVVIVPDITGLPAEQALQKLMDAGLEPAVDPERKSAGRMGPDLVALQRPAAKDSVKTGHVVRIWLSAGATTVPVPDLVGQDSMEAVTHVREAGLDIASMEFMTAAKHAAGTVIRSEPAAGTLLVRGGSIKVVFSTGTDPDSISTAGDSTKSGNNAKVF